MSEKEPPTREEALGAAESLDGLIHDAFMSVEAASEVADESQSNVGDVEAAMEEIERQARTAQESLKHVSPRTTFDELGEAWDILDGEMGRFMNDIMSHLEAAEDGEPGEHYDTLTIGDTEYEVWLTPIEDGEEISHEKKESILDQHRSGAATEDIARFHDLSTDEVEEVISDYEEAKKAQEEGLEPEHL